MPEDAPYLSVVVTARNDDHGGNLLGRMQAFVNGWIGQCKRHGVSSELIIVEWNPPADRPSLAEVLRCTADADTCQLRFIQVPAELHQQYRYAEVLPLYQMIAKNAGIRRARGMFVLATNIDILFSDELMRRFAERRLQAGRMYRIDRHDVMSEVPVDEPPDVQLAYCQRHILRINAREGTYKLTPDGQRALEDRDIAQQDSGITFGRGWFAVEREAPARVFRWAEDNAEVFARIPCNPPPPLSMEIEPGPGVGRQPFVLQVTDGPGKVQAEAVVDGLSKVSMHFPDDGQTELRFCLRVIGGGLPVSDDPRILNFRAFQCAWDAPSEARVSQGYRLEVGPPKLASRNAALSMAQRVIKAHRFYVQAGGLWKAAVATSRYFLRARKLAVKVPEGGDVFERGSGISPGMRWYPVEHVFGETFRWVDKNAELLIRSSTIAGIRNLVMVVEPGPGVGYQTFELLVQNEDGNVVARAHVEGLRRIQMPVSIQRDRRHVLKLTLESGGITAIGDPRIMNFRVFWCGWAKSNTPADLAAGAHGDLEVGLAPWAAPHSDLQTTAPVYLHTNGCGDFTLMAREHWFDLRGYPEFDLFSMNIDSVLCYAAHHAGFREEILQDPMRIYHIEHQTGSGWTPEGQAHLFARLAAKGLSFIDYQEVIGWAAQMRRLNAPMIFNRENWGLADL